MLRRSAIASLFAPLVRFQTHAMPIWLCVPHAYASERLPSTGVTTPVAILPSNEMSSRYVGIGISGLSYYDGSYAATDLIRHAEFRDTSWGYALNPDANGCPQTDFLLVIAAPETPLAVGTYTFSFTGNASVSFSASRSITKSYNSSANTTVGTLVINTKTTANTWLGFSNTRRTSASTTADGVTNIHIYRPGYDASTHFTTEFITAMQKFNCIRGMDFLNANGNGGVSWDQRTRMSWQGQSVAYSQPLELFTLLCNAASCDAYFNLPVRANDDYILKFLQVIRYGSDGTNPYTSPQANPVYPPLSSNLAVYLEYGNEIWNPGSGFNCFYWVKALSDAARLDSTHPINYAGVPDEWAAQQTYIAYRSSIISLKAREVFGDAEMMTRVRPVFAAQVNNGNGYFKTGVIWAEGFYGSVRATAPTNLKARTVPEIWYGGAGAHYVGSTADPLAAADATTVTKYFAGIPSSDAVAKMKGDVVWSLGYGLKPLAYEGGPLPGGSVTGGSGSLTSAQRDVYNMDSRMGAAMSTIHALWQQAGGQGFAYYMYSGSSSFAFIEVMGGNTAAQYTTPKMTAITTIRSTRPAAVTAGTPIPGTITMPSATGLVNVGCSPAYSVRYLALSGSVDLGHMGYLMFPINHATGGSVTFKISTVHADTGSAVQLLLNGIVAGTWTPSVSASETPTLTSTITATLEAGLTVVKIRKTVASPAVTVYQLVVA